MDNATSAVQSPNQNQALIDACLALPFYQQHADKAQRLVEQLRQLYVVRFSHYDSYANSREPQAEDPVFDDIVILHLYNYSFMGPRQAYTETYRSTQIIPTKFIIVDNTTYVPVRVNGDGTVTFQTTLFDFVCLSDENKRVLRMQTELPAALQKNAEAMRVAKEQGDVRCVLAIFHCYALLCMFVLQAAANRICMRNSQKIAFFL